jgi:hypothetical protein
MELLNGQDVGALSTTEIRTAGEDYRFSSKSRRGDEEMRYRPEALPFWELKRKDGPYTQLRKRRKMDALRDQSFTHEAIEPSRHTSHREGTKWNMARELPQSLFQD